MTKLVSFDLSYLVKRHLLLSTIMIIHDSFREMEQNRIKFDIIWLDVKQLVNSLCLVAKGIFRSEGRKKEKAHKAVILSGITLC